ncbi:T9SS C-terminal target domain-containing protein, partial [Dyadobacter sp. LJ419]|nr:T9SS C-terminal target domain-containing protein [Dyadobacter chenwenxiniae]
MKKFYFIIFLLSCISWMSYGQNAIIVTERSGAGGIVSFSPNSKLTGISDQRFVDGYVKKNGAGHFVFPVGDNGSYRPFAAEADGTVGAYFQEDPNIASVPGGGPFSVSSKDAVISTVSNKEFWDIWGTNATRLTLSWNAQSDVANLTGNSLPNLSIVGWNQTLSRWEKIASAVDEVNVLGGSSTLTSGSITTIQNIVPELYNVYTLASLNVVSTPVNYSGVLEVANCNEIKGYIWDKSYPDAVLTVEFLNGSTVFATAQANTFRADLQSAGIGTGKYGFAIPMPADLIDGQAKQISVRVRGSNYLLTGSPITVNCAYEGSLEIADCNTLKGWAMDRNKPDSAFTLELLEGTTVRATVVANLYREDLKNAGTGTGNYGFEIPVPNSLKTGKPVQLSIRVKGTTYILPGSIKTITCGAPQYYGSFELVDCNTVYGWAWAGNYPDLPLTVELVEGNIVHATGVANIYRQYLKDYNIGNGKYGFSFPLPTSLKNGQARQLSIRVQGTTYILPNSPRSVTCAAPPQFAGKFETADCNSVQGWAWASNYPDSSFTVELMEGSTVYATGVAKVYRADLKAAGTGTGYYGFDIPLPSALKSGQARQLSVRIKGSTYVLPVTAPKSVTCAAIPQYYGSFEVADCNLIQGWAWASNY